MTIEARLCEFTFSGGPLDGQKVQLGSALCECCGEMKHPDTMSYGKGQGVYQRTKGSTVFRWFDGYSVVP